MKEFCEEDGKKIFTGICKTRILYMVCQRTFPEPQTQDGLWCMTNAREHSSLTRLSKFLGQKKTTPFGVVFSVSRGTNL